jgi:hypothetical protein
MVGREREYHDAPGEHLDSHSPGVCRRFVGALLQQLPQGLFVEVEAATHQCDPPLGSVTSIPKASKARRRSSRRVGIRGF